MKNWTLIELKEYLDKGCPLFDLLGDYIELPCGPHMGVFAYFGGVLFEDSNDPILRLFPYGSANFKNLEVENPEWKLSSLIDYK